jgi:type I restriction system adenine methylase HsdM
MAIKKSDLYSSLWASCDELRGSMDASQYKDYVLFMLFIKYVSDKYGDSDDLKPPVVIPPGAGFKDMVALKGKPDIGDKINREIIQPLVDANTLLSKSDFPDFNDPNKLGKGREMVKRLSGLIDIFANLDFNATDNNADVDTTGGATFENLMLQIAINGGKYAGQLGIPLEITKLISKLIGIGAAKTSSNTTIYDPACRSGSLLLSLAAEARSDVSIYGEERDTATVGLARMNMIMHNQFTAEISSGNSLILPSFIEDESLKTFDFVVSIPPFGVKNWNEGHDPEKDSFNRFTFGSPPRHTSDYAYIQHMIASLKPRGKMAVVVPPGALFRGGNEGSIRQAIIKSDLIEAVIGLPPGLFLSTGIPSCILICNKKKPAERVGKVLFINALREVGRSGYRNVLLPENIARIENAYDSYLDIDQFSRVVSLEEISKNDFNLNIPHYVDSSELHGLLKQYCGKFEKRQIKDLALELNAGRTSQEFDSVPNAVYIPKIVGRNNVISEIAELGPKHDLFHQVVLREDVVSSYVARFLNTTIGRCALSAIASGGAMPTITLNDLKECIIAVPSLAVQIANVEIHQKLIELRKTIDEIDQQLSLNPTSSNEFELQVDSMLHIAGKQSQADHIRGIIRKGESKTVEFKETFELCLNKQTKEKYVEDSALKTIVAFLNSDGGELLIGVSDNFQIVGIERELKKFHNDNVDKFLLHLKNRLKSRIGESYYTFFNYDIVTIDGTKILHVTCNKSEKPCYLDKSDFYVRTNPATDKLDGPKLVEYVQNHFNK